MSKNSIPMTLYRILLAIARGGTAFSRADLSPANDALLRCAELLKWFNGAYGSSLCRELTKIDFDDESQVREYFERGHVSKCSAIAEETGIERSDIVGFYDLDMVSSFYDEGPDAIVAGAVFALRVRPECGVRLSHEHDAYQWLAGDEARELAVWPSYAECMERVRRHLLAPADVGWFELDLDGHRLRR